MEVLFKRYKSIHTIHYNVHSFMNHLAVLLQNKRENHMILSIGASKAFDKI